MEIRDLCIGRDYTDNMNNKKTRWTKVGVMFIKDDEKTGEQRINMIFDAYPAHGENIVAFTQKPREQKPAEENGTIQIDEAEQPAPEEDDPTDVYVDGEKVPF